MTTKALLEVQSLTCERSERILFEGLTMAVSAGSLIRIAGTNGAGKTSLLRLLTGLMSPVAGKILWRGRPIDKAQEDYWRELCYIGHKNGVKDDLSVLENLAINCRLNGLAPSERDMLTALEAVDIHGYAAVPAGQLSQGQRRRVALARLWLSQQTPLWILDEPFTALDVVGVERLAKLMSAHVQKGGIVLLVTHQEVPVQDVTIQTLKVSDFAPRYQPWPVEEIGDV